MINEATFSIASDIDYIFNKGFKSFFKLWNMRTQLMGTDVRGYKSTKHREISISIKDRLRSIAYAIESSHGYTFAQFSSSELKTKLSKLAHQTNPVKIRCGLYHNGSLYDFNNNIIQISIHSEAFALLVNDRKYLYTGKSWSVDDEGIYKEVTENRMATVIAHELSHWYRNSFHLNLDHFATKWDFKKFNSIKVDLEYFEIDAQIHAIKELKRRLGDEQWDKIDLTDVFTTITSLKWIAGELKKFDPKFFDEYQKKIIKRMHREGLLGKNMRNFARV